MSKNTIALLLSALLFTGKNAFAQSSQGWKTLDEKGYSIKYPYDWTMDNNGAYGTAFLLLSPKSSGSDRFQENINLVSQDVSEYGIDLDAYMELSFGQLRQLATNFHIISTDKIKNAAHPYYKLIYTMDQGHFNLQLEQLYWVVNKQAYVLTFTCEVDAFEAYQEIGEKIMKTFVLK